jgi:hypothetical protein
MGLFSRWCITRGRRIKQDVRLATLVDWPLSHGEGLQVLRYQVGGQYRPHFDYFPRSGAASPAHLAQGGQRIGTVIVYLNDVEDYDKMPEARHMHVSTKDLQRTCHVKCAVRT